MRSPFEFKNYKDFLREVENSGHIRAFRSYLADVAGCQNAYISQVLNGHQHLSLEQAEKVAEKFALGADEKAFFLNLVQHARAGSTSLKKFFADQIKASVEKRLTVRNRVNTGETLKEADQVTYYSEWYYSAIHVLVTIHAFRTEEKIAARLALPATTVHKAVEFLIGCGLLEEKKGQLSTGQARLFLGGDSPLIFRHHANWRLHVLQSFHRATDEDLHYSSVVTISHKDSEQIREMLIQAIQKAKTVVRESPEEELYSFCLDFYKV